MRIAYDYLAFCIQRYGGVSRYYVKLAKEIIKMKQDVKVFAPIHQNSYLSELPNENITGVGLKKYPRKTTRFFIGANKILTKPMIQSWKPNIIHETYYSRTPSFTETTPSIITVYDMIHELYLAKFTDVKHISTNKRNAIKRSQHVICISENTRNDLIRLFDVPSEKISVIPLGLEKNYLDMPVNYQLVEKRPFLLYVGARGTYKNFDSLLKAYSSDKRLSFNFDIVAFGGGDFTVREKQRISELKIKNERIIHMSGGDEILASLYTNAKAFIYPSLYEGFGLPPLEAMAYECPVISSNTSSMPEVIGDAAEFFDPNSFEDIAKAINKVVYSESRISELVKKGLLRVNKFSWTKCAEETLEIYKKIGC